MLLEMLHNAINVDHLANGMGCHVLQKEKKRKNYNNMYAAFSKRAIAGEISHATICISE